MRKNEPEPPKRGSSPTLVAIIDFTLVPALFTFFQCRGSGLMFSVFETKDEPSIEFNVGTSDRPDI